MKNALIRALALWLALWPALVVAQQFPVVPDKTVIGRIGTGSSSGPAQAIPFATLYTNLTGASSALANQIPVYQAGGLTTPTTVGGSAGFFDTIFCSTVGQLITRTSGGWACAKGIRANVAWWGAKCDGSTDDTTAFQTAATAAGAITSPPGTCIITSAITFPAVNGAGFVGQGRAATVIQINSTSAEAFVQTGFTNDAYYAHFTLTRSGTPTSSATGLDLSGSMSLALVDDVIIQNHYVGLKLGPTDWSMIKNSIIQLNTNNGVLQVNSAGNGSSQWSTDEVLLQANGGWGWLFSSVAGPLQVSVGTMNRTDTFANTSGGIAWTGGSTVPIFGIRLQNSFLGQDNGDEVHIDSGATGGAHVLSNLFIELAGTAATGPTFSTPAGNAGHGIDFITGADLIVSNARVTGNSNHGLISTGARTYINGGMFANNGASGGSGIVINAAGDVIISGVRSGNLSGTSQAFGVFLGGFAINGVISSNNLSGNGTSAVSNSSTGTTLRIKDNTGYNPVGLTAGTSTGVSASTITAGPSPETHYITQSATFNAAVKSGATTLCTVATATVPCVLELGPNESYSVTWTTTQPTYSKFVH